MLLDSTFQNQRRSGFASVWPNAGEDPTPNVPKKPAVDKFGDSIPCEAIMCEEMMPLVWVWIVHWSCQIMPIRFLQTAAAVVGLCCIAVCAQAQDQPVKKNERAVTISAAQRNENGILIHKVESPYQAGVTEFRILAPEKIEPNKRYRVVYVLPVEAGREARYGDGLVEVQKLGLQNRYATYFVAPTFSHLPWYADHPANAEIRQESYFLKVVVPFVEKQYPAISDRQSRLLLGFSKSGWGAWSLLLRHPDVFGRAAAWDAPLDKDHPDQFGMGDIFSTQDNFQQYQIKALLKCKANILQSEKRLILLGYGNFRSQHTAIHTLLTDLKIPHEYHDGPARKHDWHSGWVQEAAELLLVENAAAVRVTIDFSEAPELSEWAANAGKLVEKWNPLISEILKSDGFTPPPEVKLIFKKDMPGVAATSGATISIAANWIKQHPDDYGMVVHELTHVVQSYPRNNAGWLVEGIADYIRFFRYEPDTKLGPLDVRKANYRNGYRTAARFLAWLEKTHDPHIIRRLNSALRLSAYRETLFNDYTGKSLDELWARFIFDQ